MPGFLAIAGRADLCCAGQLVRRSTGLPQAQGRDSKARVQATGSCLLQQPLLQVIRVGASGVTGSTLSCPAMWGDTLAWRKPFSGALAIQESFGTSRTE